MSGWSNIGHCEQTILFWGKIILTFAYAGRRRRSGSTHKYVFTISENCTVRWDAVGENNGLSVRAFLIISVRIYLWLHYIKIKCALTLPSQTIIVSVCRNTPLSFSVHHIMPRLSFAISIFTQIADREYVWQEISWGLQWSILR